MTHHDKAPELVERLKVVSRCGTDSTMRHSAYAFMAQDPDGDYVTYSAYAALAEENRMLREALRELVAACESYPVNIPRADAALDDAHAALRAIDVDEVLARLPPAPDAVARLWHAARLGLDMARANDLTNTAETIMEAMNAVECPCKGSDEMCPCQNRRPAPDSMARLADAARAENERLQAILDNLHAVEEKHRETANAEFHRANRLQVENERLRTALAFYTVSDNWCIGGPLDGNSPSYTGGPARAALAQKGGE